MLTTIVISLLISLALIFLYKWHFKILRVKDVILSLIPIMNIIGLLMIIFTILTKNIEVEKFLNKEL